MDIIEVWINYFIMWSIVVVVDIRTVRWVSDLCGVCISSMRLGCRVCLSKVWIVYEFREIVWVVRDVCL